MKTAEDLFDPYTPPPFAPEEDDYSIEVGVIMEGEHFKGYVDENGTWWVHYGGITVGHRETDTDEIESWYYFPSYPHP